MCDLCSDYPDADDGPQLQDFTDEELAGMSAASLRQLGVVRTEEL